MSESLKKYHIWIQNIKTGQEKSGEVSVSSISKLVDSFAQRGWVLFRYCSLD